MILCPHPSRHKIHFNDPQKIKSDEPLTSARDYGCIYNNSNDAETEIGQDTISPADGSETLWSDVVIVIGLIFNCTTDSCGFLKYSKQCQESIQEQM